MMFIVFCDKFDFGNQLAYLREIDRLIVTIFSLDYYLLLSIFSRQQFFLDEKLMYNA